MVSYGRRMTLRLGISVVAGVVAAAFVVLLAIGLRRSSNAGDKGDERKYPKLALGGDSCAAAHPVKDVMRGPCDREPSPTNCRLDDTTRLRYRRGVSDEVGAVQFEWRSALQSLRVVEQLESGDLPFTQILGQSILNTTFGLAGSTPPLAPFDKQAFLEVLKCSPWTWATSITSTLNQRTDDELMSLVERLPALGEKLEFEARMAFVKAPVD